MKSVLAAAMPLLAAACAPMADLPEASPFTAAADPVMIAYAESGPSVTYVPREINAPGDWRSLNDAQVEGSQ